MSNLGKTRSNISSMKFNIIVAGVISLLLQLSYLAMISFSSMGQVDAPPIPVLAISFMATATLIFFVLEFLVTASPPKPGVAKKESEGRC